MLDDIVAALDVHPGEHDIQIKGLVLLGVLIQASGGTEDKNWYQPRTSLAQHAAQYAAQSAAEHTRVPLM